MSDRIQISVPRVPWHCEHKVNKKECEICVRPDPSGPDDSGSASGGGDSSAGPVVDGSADSGPGGSAERYTAPGGDSWWGDDPILRRAAFND